MNEQQPGRWRRTLTEVIGPLAAYGLVAVAITWPLLKHITTHAAGLGVADTYEVTRHIWWAREALLDGRNPFDQTALVYPDGFMSWVQWSHPLQYLPGALVALVVSPLTAFNIMLLVTLALNGLAAFRLGLEISGGRWLAAWLGGLVFMAFPAAQGHLAVGHLGILTLWPVPLLVICARRVLYGTASWRTVGWGAAWFALAGLAYVSHLVFVILPLVVVWGLVLLARDRERLWTRGLPPREQRGLRLGAIFVLGGLLLVPFYGPLLTSAGRAELGDVAETGRVAFSADALGFASPSPFGPLADLGLDLDYTHDVLGVNSAEGTAYLGVIAVGLAVAGMAAGRRELRGWLVVALGAMVLSLGPLLKWRDAPVVVHVEDFESHILLPWALLKDLPVLDATRTPGRFNLLTGLALSVLVSGGAGVLLARIQRRALALGLVAALSGLILVEYQLFDPYPTGDATQPAYFDALAARDDVRAVLDVPVANELAAKVGLYQQVFHGKPLIAGHALRRTPQDPAILAVLERAATARAEGLPAITPEEAAYTLSAAGADRVIVQKQFYPADLDAVQAWLAQVAGSPEYEDERLAVYAVPRTDPPPEGSGLLWAWSYQDWLTAEGVNPALGEVGALHFYASAALYGDLAIPLEPYGAPRRFAVRLDGALLGAFWAEGEAIRLPLWVEAGFHTLQFAALGGCDPYPFTLTCLAGDCAPLDPPLCISATVGAPNWEPAEPMPQPLDVQLAEGMRLRAYDLSQEVGAVSLRLFWEVDSPLDRSYALFAHLADPDTAEPLAQYDAFPLVATDDWDGGAAWVSEVWIELPNDLPPGKYAVNVGWFDPASGERLAVRGARPWAAAGILHVATVMVE